jgi:hypothetical protein
MTILLLSEGLKDKVKQNFVGRDDMSSMDFELSEGS